jgi:hypothetical protein
LTILGTQDCIRNRERVATRYTNIELVADDGERPGSASPTVAMDHIAHWRARQDLSARHSIRMPIEGTDDRVMALARRHRFVLEMLDNEMARQGNAGVSDSMSSLRLTHDGALPPLDFR